MIIERELRDAVLEFIEMTFTASPETRKKTAVVLKNKVLEASVVTTDRATQPFTVTFSTGAVLHINGWHGLAAFLETTTNSARVLMANNGYNWTRRMVNADTGNPDFYIVTRGHHGVPNEKEPLPILTAPRPGRRKKPADTERLGDPSNY